MQGSGGFGGAPGRDGADAASNGRLLASLAAEMEALRAENARLASSLAAMNSGGGPAPAPAGFPTATTPQISATTMHFPMPEETSGAPLPRKSYGEMKLWVGSWNMGAADPFADFNVPREREAISRTLSAFIPTGYDVYVLGVQEGISDKVFEAVEAHTGSFRLPLNAKLYPAREHIRDLGKGIRSRRMGRAIPIQAFIDDAKEGIMPDVVATTGDMLDRVWGRGDGALLTPKFTGIAVFVAPVVAPYCKLLGVYKHSFGASEGSKGGVGVALALYDVNMVFVNAHMASKKPDLRRAQYCELVDRLGAKLGGRGFGLNEEFHHVVWMGDLNYHCKGVSAREATALIAANNHMQLLLDHDELLDDKENELAFYEYEEPLMAPRFFPTYKKIPARGRTNYRSPTWPDSVYMTKFKEPFYKGGREVDRVPSWTDRIQYHSLPDRSGELLPEPLDPDHPETSLHNYQAVNDGLDISDHSPVFATFSLQISSEEVDEAVAEAIEGMQSQMGYRFGGVDDASDRGDDAGSIISAAPSLARAHGMIPDADFGALHPSLRPLEVILTLRNIVVQYKGQMRSPRAVNVLFPLPYEDSNEIPDRTKVVRAGSLFSPFGSGLASESRETLTAILPPCLVSRASKLESLHLLLKISLDDNTKAQCVICMRDGGFVSAGSHVNTFLLPLTTNGLPLKDPSGKRVQIQFELKMEAYERGGTMSRPGGALVSRRPHAGSESSVYSAGTPTRMVAGRSSPGAGSYPQTAFSPGRRPPPVAPEPYLQAPIPRGVAPGAYPARSPGAGYPPVGSPAGAMRSPLPRGSPMRGSPGAVPAPGAGPVVRSVASIPMGDAGRTSQLMAAKARAAARAAASGVAVRSPPPPRNAYPAAAQRPAGEAQYINDDDYE